MAVGYPSVPRDVPALVTYCDVQSIQETPASVDS
jgi:hypothetical protein